jgi:single-stranded-DNA-specific exonuclease
MTLMEKRWKMRPYDIEAAAALQESLKINPVLCRMLAQRGITSFDGAREFFRPDLSHLHDPFLMKDMDKAVERILRARSHKERILIYGDYDVDGTTAVGCMYNLLSGIIDPALLDFYIPHRYREGYGISMQGVDYAVDKGFTLVIALDCGVKSGELIGRAKDKGVDFIVCDHHLPGPELPPAVALLNPKQAGCAYPYKELCGCGVGFKLVMALCRTLGLPESLYLDMLDLVATAIAADIVPLTGENRTLAYFGLKKANENPCIALKAIMDVGRARGRILIQHLVFMVAPRVNAAGRMDDARKVIELFVEKDPVVARVIAERLQTDNEERREADQSTTEEALALIRSGEHTLTKATVVYRPHWHKGVVGIVASRLIDHFYRPTIVLTQSGDLVSGSARSIAGFNIHDGLEQCKEHLLSFGGHYFAAGMTLRPEEVEAFARKFEAVVASSLEEEMFTPEILIDAEVSFGDCTLSFYEIIAQMEPFGPENPQPVLLAKGVWDSGQSRIVKENHLRFEVRQGTYTLTGIGFNLAQKYPMVSSGQPFDVLFHLEENEWQGVKKLQMKVIDIRPGG